MMWTITKDDVGKVVDIDKMFKSIFETTNTNTQTETTQTIKTAAATTERKRPGPKPKTPILKQTTVARTNGAGDYTGTNQTDA